MPTKTPETVQDQMIHLLTGNLHGLSAALLRRRIAREPGLAQEWSELQAMRVRLQQSPMPASQRPAPQWGGPRALDLPDSALRKRTRKRRCGTAVVLTLPTVAVGTAFYVWSQSNVIFHDAREHTWVLHSTFPGEVRLYDMSGAKVGAFRTAPLFSFLAAPGGVRVRMDDQSLKFVYGEGTHPLRNGAGAIAGYAVLVPDTPLDESEREYSMIALLQDNTFALGEVLETGSSWTSPDATGYVNRKTGLAWKLQGRAIVTFGYGTAPLSAPQQQTPEYPRHSLIPPSLNEPPKTPWQTQQEAMQENFLRRRKPLLQWSIAASASGPPPHHASDYLLYRGRWVHPWRSGEMRSYGRHTIRDDTGKPIVTFDIQPLPPVAVPAMRR